MADNVRGGSNDAALPLIATDDVSGVQFQRVKLDVGGDGVTTPVTGATGLPVAGDVATDSPNTGNPIQMGGVFQTLPTAVASGDRTALWTGSRGQVYVSIKDAFANEVETATGGADNGTTGDPASRGLIGYSRTQIYNDTTAFWERQRNNEDVTFLTSASRTTTQTQADQVNYNWRGIKVVLDMTVVGTGSVTLTIQGKDAISGKYFTLLAGAAVVGNSTNIYTVFPGAPVTTNVSANDFVPRTFRLLVTANNANAATYSVGYSLVV
jgi:hypothetical protein